MSRRVTVYIGLTAALAVSVVLGWLWAEPPTAAWPWLGGVVLVVACIVLEIRCVEMPGGNAVSIATIPHLAAILLLPPPMALVAAGVGILFDHVRLGHPRSRVIFNTANTVATVGITALVADRLGVRGLGLVDGGLDDVARFFVVALTYYATNNVVLAGVMALASNRPFLQVFWIAARSSAPAEFAVAVIGGLAVFVWLTNAAWLPLVLFPMLVAQLTLDYLSASHRKATELEYQAFHDALTGLPNRTALQRDLGRALASQGLGRPRLALLMMDLDGFKEVNDTFGHLKGDALLREVATRLKEHLGERGMVARLGGDEFAVLLPASEVTMAEQVAHELLDVLASPFSIETMELFLSASIGIARAPEHGRDVETLLRRADVAMYAAKKAREGTTIYSPEFDQHDRERLALIHDLHVALNSEGAMALAYQPKVCASTGRLHSVEALLRWTHPTRGPISPAEFVPLAEEAGLSKALSRWVLGTALRQNRLWLDQGHRIRVCVNISMYDLRDRGFPAMVAELLAEHGVDPDLLGIEITESAAMADPLRTRAVLEGLRALGARVSIDDFGTGYSSLAYLTTLPVDELKIDRSFVLGMQGSAKDATIVRSTVSLGHDLGLSVVAEGVEDDATWDRLRAFGCDLIQGYVVARPLFPAALAEWLDDAQQIALAA